MTENRQMARAGAQRQHGWRFSRLRLVIDRMGRGPGLLRVRDCHRMAGTTGPVRSGA